MSRQKKKPVHGRVNQQEIARLLGVSQMTISRVLNDRPSVAPKLKNKILRKSRQLGYVHDRVAAGLKSRATRVIGLIIPDVNASFFPEITTSIERRASKEGYGVILAHTHEAYAAERDAVHMFRGFRVEGFIIAPAGRQNEIDVYGKLGEAEIPFVFVDRTKKKVDCSFVATDIEQGTLELGRYLVGNGYRKWAYLEGLSGVSSSMEHSRGLRRSVAEQAKGHVEIVSVPAGFHEEGGYKAARELFKKWSPDVVIGVNDAVAIGALRFMKERKLKVPKDIALAGFSDLRAMDMLDVPLTTVREPTAEIGKRSFEILLDEIRNPALTKRTVRLRPTLVARESA